MADYYYELSWKAVLKAYTFKQFCKDSLLPLIMTMIFVVLACYQQAKLLTEMIVKVCDLMISLLPAFISILIAAFAIWISFFLSNTIGFIKKDDGGKDLLNELNASFLIEICFSIIGMLFTLTVLLISVMEFYLPEPFATVVNITTLSVLLFVCFSVIWWLIYIAKNLHNIAKFTILYDRIESMKSGSEDEN